MLGPWELALIALIALLIFGGTRLAGIGKSAGKAIKEFKDEVGKPSSELPANQPQEPTTAAPDDSNDES